MRLGNGSYRKTPVWFCRIVLGCGLLLLPGAALVLGQEFSEPLPLTKKVLPNPVGPPIPVAVTPRDENPWTMGSYDVSDLLERMRESEPEILDPKQALLAFLYCRFPGVNGESSTPSGKQIQFADKTGIIVLGRNEPTMKIVNGKLFVFDTPEQIHFVTEALQRFRKFGFGQIMVEVRFVSTTRDEMNNLGLEWSIAASDTKEPDLPLAFIGSGGKNHETASAIPIIAAEDKIRQVSATSYVEKSAPVLYAVLKDKQIRTFFEKATGNDRTNILTAPKVTLFNGQEATIKDVTTRPFVVGLNRVKDASGKTPDEMQSVVRTVDEGTSIRLQPVLRDQQKIELSSELILSSIQGVETAEIPLSANKKPVAIQIPEVAVTRIRTSLEIPVGETLVLGSFPKGEDQTLLVLLTCRIAEKAEKAKASDD